MTARYMQAYTDDTIHSPANGSTDLMWQYCGDIHSNVPPQAGKKNPGNIDANTAGFKNVAPGRIFSERVISTSRIHTKCFDEKHLT